LYPESVHIIHHQEANTYNSTDACETYLWSTTVYCKATCAEMLPAFSFLHFSVTVDKNEVIMLCGPVCFT